MWRWLVAGGAVVCLGGGGALHAAVGAGQVEAGATLYHERCSPCHGVDGKAMTPMAQALTRMAAAARNFNLGSVSNSDLAWVAVGAGSAD